LKQDYLPSAKELATWLFGCSSDFQKKQEKPFLEKTRLSLL
jgi:hypothetical protein